MSRGFTRMNADQNFSCQIRVHRVYLRLFLCFFVACVILSGFQSCQF